jgi:hypothetical protein
MKTTAKQQAIMDMKNSNVRTSYLTQQNKIKQLPNLCSSVGLLGVCNIVNAPMG